MLNKSYLTMKNKLGIIVLVFVSAVAISCSQGGDKTEATEAKAVKSASYDQLYSADLTKSVINWQGYKPTGKHNGTINISDGKLEVKAGNLVGGEFTINMNSIKVLDLKDADDNAKLLGHLKSADFFEVETYPSAKFVITGVKAIDGTAIDKTKEKGSLIPTHSITGNLSMKDETKSISFNALIEQDQNSISAKTNQFYIDRVEWNVQYGSKKIFSELKDKFIHDEMGIAIKLLAQQK